MGADLTTRPLIGVTTSEVRLAARVQLTPEGEPPDREMALGMKYLRAIERAGGLPVVMPPLDPEAIEPLLDNLSGVCLSGGPDISPVSYNRQPDAHLGPTEPDLDRFELMLALRADARSLPILAVCRGAQVLNVARGGTLHQHLPDVVGDAVVHRAGPGQNARHTVEVAPDSLLARVLGETSLEVNSYHHQAAAKLGRGLRAVAWAPDGIVEGIEAPERDFVLGVQWHAEAIAYDPAQALLFDSFVEASRRFEATGLRAARAA
jgi:putative glutamine amidotransferase